MGLERRVVPRGGTGLILFPVASALVIASFAAARDRPQTAPTSPVAEPAPQAAGAPARPQETTHNEKPYDPYVAVPPEARRTSRPANPTRNGFTAIQVNVDGDGMNILGDAANEPSIAVDPTNGAIMAIGWRQFDTVSSSFRQAGVGSSRDNGFSWTFAGVLEPGVFRSDPVLEYDISGNFFYSSLSRVGDDFFNDVFMSSDGGRTWTKPVFAWGGDKQWMAIDRTPDGIGLGNIYANWTLFLSSCEGQMTVSYDQGDSYADCVGVPGEPQWGTIAIGPNGEVYVAGRGFVVAKSSSLQDPKNPPVFDFVIDVDLGGELGDFGGPNPTGLLGQAWIQADLSDGETRGNLYLLCSVDPPDEDPLDVKLARSVDGGLTWTPGITVNDVRSGWQWFGTLSVAPNGRIDVVWNDTRNDPGGYLTELYYRYSNDAGRTWSDSVALTPPWHPHDGWPQQNKIGDYYHMRSDNVGADLAFAATLNGEQDIYYMRIGDTDCNRNGLPDADDIATGRSFDGNRNGLPDECDDCFADLDGDGDVGFFELVQVLSVWGPCEDCPEDLDGNGIVEFGDVLFVLSVWGPCE